ncbi:Uncharacterised protein [Serratia liquefaciens]|uniref:hypothetical protein n=1 Tax=Serratia liquefaciens TaxID=614 RepID=UPI00217727E9|nr:hypothetical protein [Serratia liquefaciens]CAI1169915.1 Uncharacterised protein [Serratia liquefaciens]
MNNKLSELSKPVVWPNGCNETAVNALRYLAENKRPIGGSDMYNTEHLYMIASELTRIANKPLYSQEYVSALLAELEAKDKRIAELERSLTDAWRERDDWVEHSSKMERRAIETERKLATPVRLPTTSGRLGVAYTRVIPEVIESIRAAGFTVEGDE